MNTAVKTGAFVAALAAAFGVAYGAGAAMDPVADPEPAAHAHHGAHDKEERTGKKGETAADAGHAAGGLQISESGYTLDLDTPRIASDRSTEVRFSVRDAAGRKVTAYRKAHGKELHLILAGRDLTTYQHLHPARAADGTWRTDVKLPKAGDYRLFTDFTPAAKGAGNLTLGADLAVSGTYQPAALPKATRTTTVDGYTVNLEGDLTPGKARELTLKVAKDGREVTDLQPYLEAYGHLVALRSGDLAYLHVHPGGHPGDGVTKPGPAISFTATASSSGTYRLFLDFKHNGTVRTAAFTLPATAPDGEEKAALAPHGEEKREATSAETAEGGHQH
ncbi:hypothetical protein [Streptomyces sp. XD-27]|uniref:hypothetical protein n=1 Tax=Streptomyces sp. XD-27 TaxID=3062779 RepID=UPI0026F427AF|nr:hypothetical protein [Streptomyces sp. XD-27]WKX69386.1 hypothetical protein Q3Y56_05165 [Streptomyces sp. XD-27]